VADWLIIVPQPQQKTGNNSNPSKGINRKLSREKTINGVPRRFIAQTPEQPKLGSWQESKWNGN